VGGSVNAWRVLDAPARLLDKVGVPIRVRGSGAPGLRDADTEALVRRHFTSRSRPDHINLESMRTTLMLLKERPSRIVETGMAAWGTNSTLLFADYVERFGGELWSVDIRLQPIVTLRSSVSSRTALTCGDSVRFLRRWVARHRGDCTVDLAYLDSFDLDPSDPFPAARHGLAEFLAVRPALGPGSLLLIDDTPATPDHCPRVMREPAERFLKAEGMMPGKGMLVVQHLEGVAEATKLLHGYQVLYRFDGGLTAAARS
jgi:hypothetical protein